MTPPTLNREELLAKWKPTIEQAFDIFSWTSGHELAWLCEMATQACEIIEVGSYHGKSALCMRYANPRAGITCLDIPQDDRCRLILAANTIDQCIAVYEMTAQQFKFSGKRDFAFVDAGHTEEDVSGDIAALLPHMAPGAIMSGHDWRTDNMQDGVNLGVLRHFKFEQVHTFESIWWVQLP